VTYPPALFSHIASLCQQKRTCWDCATGSGQAALSWTSHFDQVIATDASQQQLDHAVAHQKIVYRSERAEKTTITSQSVDLVSVASALHWFDHDLFYTEARRVLRPGGIVAVWSYDAHPVISPEIDHIIHHHADHRLGPYWPAPFEHVRTKYRNLPFPFAELSAPDLVALVHWSFDELMGNLRTWSAVRPYVANRGEDPVSRIEPALRRLWGVPDRIRPCSWPLFFRIGRVG
jgi:SAM-dependent methyltransferase